jgi:hypothetical protein
MFITGKPFLHISSLVTPLSPVLNPLGWFPQFYGIRTPDIVPVLSGITQIVSCKELPCL